MANGFKKNNGGKLLAVFLLTGCLILTAGCSRRDVPPPPKTQPELLLEIYDSARKNQYDAALLKIQKMRALDPTSVFLAELENAVRFNRLTAVVDAYLKMGNFEAALKTVHQYELKYGFHESTSKAKEQLTFLARLDQLIQEIKEARRSEEMERSLKELTDLSKNIQLSAKIRNFMKKSGSVLTRLRREEYARTMAEILRTAEECFQKGETGAAEALAAVYALEYPRSTEIRELLSRRQ